MLNVKSSLFLEEERVAGLEPPWEVNKDNLNGIIFFAFITFNYLVTIFSKVSKWCVISIPESCLQTYFQALRIYPFGSRVKIFQDPKRLFTLWSGPCSRYWYRIKYKDLLGIWIWIWLNPKLLAGSGSGKNQSGFDPGSSGPKWISSKTTLKKW